MNDEMPKIVHPSELPRYTQAIHKGPMAGTQRGRPGDPALDRPERPCAKCGKQFQPTVRRRLLCGPCFNGGD